MFPYLRTKKEFLGDSERINYRVEQRLNGNDGYQLLKNPERSFYGRTRGCERNNHRCSGCYKYRDCEFDLNDEDRYWRCKECLAVSDLTAWLVNNVNLASWKVPDKNDRIGSVKISELHAWCQSVGVYMHDVVKCIETDNLVIGLESYTDETSDSHVRADMIIAGFGDDGHPIIIVVELKQWSREYIVRKKIKLYDPVSQVVSYASLLKDKAETAGIEIIPCVYLHNLSRDDLGDLPENVTENIDLNLDENDALVCTANEDENVNENIIEDDWEVKMFLRESSFGSFLNDLFTDSENEAKDIIKRLKQHTNVLSIGEIAEIMFNTLDTELGSTKTLRPDQKYAYNEIIKKINSGGDYIEIINGASGSGKTVLVAYLIRYAIQHEKKVAFVYHGTAPRNALFTSELISRLTRDSFNFENGDESFYSDMIASTFAMGERGRVVTSSIISSLRDKVSSKIAEINEMPETIRGSRERKIVEETVRAIKNNIPLIMYNLDQLQAGHFNPENDEYILDPDYPLIGLLEGILDDLDYWQHCIDMYETKLPETIKKWMNYCCVRHYSNFIKEDESYDLVLFDEFHRFDGTDEELDQILDKARGTVLLIDRLQDIDSRDRGVTCCENLTEQYGNVTERQLWSQFRCNFQEGYISWVDSVLQLDTPSSSCFVIGQDSSDDSIYLSDLDFDAEIIDRDRLIELLSEDLGDPVDDKDALMCLSEADEQEINDIFRDVDGEYSFAKINGIVNPFIESEGVRKKIIGRAYQVQGLEYKSALVIIDGRLRVEDNRLTLDEDLLWQSKLDKNTRAEITARFGEMYDIFNTRWKNCKWSELAAYVRELASPYDFYDEEDFADFDECFVKMEYFYPEVDKQLSTLKKKYRVLLTRGLKRCYIYASDESLRKYLMKYAQRPE